MPESAGRRLQISNSGRKSLNVQNKIASGKGPENGEKGKADRRQENGRVRFL